MRLYYHRDTNIDEFFFNDETPLVWNAGETPTRPHARNLFPPPPLAPYPELPLPPIGHRLLTGTPTAGFVGVTTGLEASKAPPGLAAAPSGPNSVVQVAALKGSGRAVVSYVRGTTGRFEDNTCDLPARFAHGDGVNDGAPGPRRAGAIALSHNFGLYVLTGDGTRILECESSSPYSLLIPSSSSGVAALLVWYLPGNSHSSLRR